MQARSARIREDRAIRFVGAKVSPDSGLRPPSGLRRPHECQKRLRGVTCSPDAGAV